MKKPDMASDVSHGMLSRREAVKLIGTGVCAGAAGVSGCLGDDTTLVSQGSSGRVNPEIRDDRLSRDGFDNYAEEMRGVYGDNGVWGREDEDGGAPESLGYVGAWTQDSEVANNSGRNDSAVAVYTTGRTVEMAARGTSRTSSGSGTPCGRSYLRAPTAA